MAAFFTSPDFTIGVLSLLFTILILSYVVGDNVFFRLALHIFIGISTGYVAAIVLLQVIANKIIIPLLFGVTEEKIYIIVPTILAGAFLLTKISPRIEWLSRPVVAFLVGTGAAAAVAGAILGTIYPQIGASANMFGPTANASAYDIINSLFVLVGTVATLAYFQFIVLGKKAANGKRDVVFNIMAIIGQIFIAITLGTLFAGVFSAALTALVERLEFIILFIEKIITAFL